MILRRPVSTKSLAFRRFPDSVTVQNEVVDLRIVEAYPFDLLGQLVAGKYPILDPGMDRHQTTIVKQQAQGSSLVQRAQVVPERGRVRQSIERLNCIAHSAIIEVDVLALQEPQHSLVMVAQHRLRPPLPPQLRHQPDNPGAVRPAIDQIADKNRNAAVGMVEVVIVTELSRKPEESVEASVHVADDVVELMPRRGCVQPIEFRHVGLIPDRRDGLRALVPCQPFVEVAQAGESEKRLSEFVKLCRSQRVEPSSDVVGQCAETLLEH